MKLAAPHCTSLREREFERILLIKPSSLGDIIHALPVLHGLRRRYPTANISWLVNRAFAPLLAGHPALDEVIEFDRRFFGRITHQLAATRGFVGFVRELRARRFDLVIDLQGLFRSGFLAWASGAAVRIGLGDARELAPLFHTHRIRVPRTDTHAADRNYRVAAVLGFDDAPLCFDLALTHTEHAAAVALLAEVGLAADQPFAAVFPGARWETKRWFADRFVATIDALSDRRELRTVLLGGADEADLCAEIAKQCRAAPRPLNLAGRTDLRSLPAVIARATVVLCHDSAPMHIAAALDRPQVCLLGPTNPRRTGPYSRAARVLQAPLPCAPCYLKRLSQCPYSHECMHWIEPERVLAAIGELLAPPSAMRGSRAVPALDAARLGKADGGS